MGFFYLKALRNASKNARKLHAAEVRVARLENARLVMAKQMATLELEKQALTPTSTASSSTTPTSTTSTQSRHSVLSPSDFDEQLMRTVFKSEIDVVEAEYDKVLMAVMDENTDLKRELRQCQFEENAELKRELRATQVALRMATKASMKQTPSKFVRLTGEYLPPAC